MSNEKLPPLPGMKEIPYGLPLMMAEWVALARWAATKREIVEQFQKDAGITIPNILASPLDRIIDDSLRLDSKLGAAWCDWVTANLWIDASEEDEDE